MAAFRRFDAESDAYVAILCGVVGHTIAVPTCTNGNCVCERSSSVLGAHKDMVPIPAICCSSRSMGSRSSLPCKAMYLGLAWALCSIAI
jgi:hypothetical protein